MSDRDTYGPLPSGVIKGLGDKLYDKRKNAALEVEKCVRAAGQTGGRVGGRLARREREGGRVRASQAPFSLLLLGRRLWCRVGGACSRGLLLSCCTAVEGLPAKKEAETERRGGGGKERDKREEKSVVKKLSLSLFTLSLLLSFSLRSAASCPHCHCPRLLPSAHL